MTDAGPARGAVVLVGGRSRRMGRDKASLPFRATTLLSCVLSTLSEVVDEIIVVARRNQALPPFPPTRRRTPIEVTFDDIDGLGPVGGLAAGLTALRSPVAYLSACDTPFLRSAFVRAMFEALGSADVAVPQAEGRIHPLAGVYRRAPALGAARALLAVGRLRPIYLLETLSHVVVGEDFLRRADPDLRSLENLNSPDDLDRADARYPDRPE